VFKKRQKPLLIPLCFLCSIAFADETHRLVQRIKGVQYLVEYRVSADGSVSVEPTHIQTTTGWVSIDKGTAFAASDSKGTEQVVRLGEREMSVRFSQNGLMKVAGEVYAVKGQAGDWVPGNQSGPARKSSAPSKKQDFSQAQGTQKATTVAEFRLYDPAVRGVSMTSRETRPRVEGKVTQYPNIQFSVSPRINDSSNSLSVGIQVGLTGTSQATDGEVGPLGKWTGATVNSQISGRYDRDFYLNRDGVSSGPLRGQAKITPHISVGTQVRAPLLKGVAKRVAARRANGEVASKLPVKQQELTAEVERSTSEAASSANELIQKNMSQLSRFSFARDIPLDLRFSSHANNGAPGYLAATLSTKQPFDTAERPDLNVPGQVATLYINQNAINEVISPLLSGEEINLGEAMKRICSDPLMQQLPICAQKLDPDIEKLVVVFDKDKPFDIQFEGGKVSVSLNLSHDVLQEGKGSKEVAFKGSPYSIVSTYSVSAQGLKRNSVRTEPRDVSAVASAEPKKEGSHSSLGFLNRALRATAKSVAGIAEQSKVRDAYEKAFEKKIDFKRVALPQSVHVENPSAKGTPVVTQRREYYPSQVKAENGWFAMSFSMGPAFK
jgi:hypothetical protein